MSDLRPAVAAGVLGAEEAHRQLLQATVEVARAIFAAKAATVFLYDDQTDELVFEAVAGMGAETLIGNRIPSSTGIAGWVLVTRQPLVLEDVTQDPRWGGQEIAERTGYAPNGLMAVPLIHDEDSVGVLQVLDRPQESRFSLQEMDLLGLFANQAAIALDLLRKTRRARAVLEDGGADIEVLARLAGNLDELEGKERKAGLELIRSLDTLLKR
jgi:GAF domain-containing protein